MQSLALLGNILLTVCFAAGKPSSASVFGELGEVKKNTDAAKNYFAKYGYVKKYCSGCSSMKESLQIFQQFANLKITGVLDKATIKQMGKRRCGVRDPINRLGRRTKRYIAQGTKWAKVSEGKALTWRYGKKDARTEDEGITDDLDRPTVLRVLREAMGIWSSVTNIEFEEDNNVNNDVDIYIFFQARSHGDPYAFDGEGGTLAHAFYPLLNRGFAGDVHFDDDELFTDKSAMGRNLLWVATHELGHSLGLDHSDVRSAIMFPWYTGYKGDTLTLPDDDKRGIQSIYGKKTAKPPTKRPTEKPTERPTEKPTTTPAKKSTGNCPGKGKVTSIWTIPNDGYGISTNDGKRYNVLKSGKVYAVSAGQQEGVVDAAFTAKFLSTRSFGTLINLPGRGRGVVQTVKFTGETYNVFNANDNSRVSGPHSIHGNDGPLNLGLPSYVKRIEAAIIWQRSEKIYLFYRRVIGGKTIGYYKRYNPQKKKRYNHPVGLRYGVFEGSPKETGRGWRFLPAEGPDAAVSHRNPRKTYFIVGNTLYRSNDRRIRLYKKRSDPTYKNPKPVGAELIRC